MQIIKPHSTISKKVSSYDEIKTQAEQLLSFTKSGPFQGFYKSCYALHHSQVSEKPHNFFTLTEDASKFFGGEPIIVNPEILDKELSYKVNEACMSWPFRNLKKVERFMHIKAKYEILKGGKLKLIEEDLYGLAAQIFQHETDHGNGKMIHQI